MNTRQYKKVNKDFQINIETELQDEPLLNILDDYLDNDVDIYFTLVNEMNEEGTTTVNILNSSIFNPQLNAEPGIINKEILYRLYDITTNGLIVNNKFIKKYKEDDNLKYFKLLDLVISNFSDLKIQYIPKCIITAKGKKISEEERKIMVAELKQIYNKNENKNI